MSERTPEQKAEWKRKMDEAKAKKAGSVTTQERPMNTPISEPYASRALATRQRLREEKWPGTRFTIASLYRVGKASETPQFEDIMEQKLMLGVDIRVLARGDREDDRKYIGPASVLMGEPMDEWEARQADHLATVKARIRMGSPVSLSSEHVSSSVVGDPTGLREYEGSADELS